MTYVREGWQPVWHVTDNGTTTRCGLVILDSDVMLGIVADGVRRCPVCGVEATVQELDTVIAQAQLANAVEQFGQEECNGNGLRRTTEVRVRGGCYPRRHRGSHGRRRH
jgi:hypothetical protein